MPVSLRAATGEDGMALSYKCSLQACSCLSPPSMWGVPRDSKITPTLMSVLDMEADWSPTARFDEHRLSTNTIDLVCALGEQRRPTVSMANFPTCACHRRSK